MPKREGYFPECLITLHKPLTSQTFNFLRKLLFGGWSTNYLANPCHGQTDVNINMAKLLHYGALTMVFFWGGGSDLGSFRFPLQFCFHFISPNFWQKFNHGGRWGQMIQWYHFQTQRSSRIQPMVQQHCSHASKYLITLRTFRNSHMCKTPLLHIYDPLNSFSLECIKHSRVGQGWVGLFFHKTFTCRIKVPQLV